MMMDPIRSQQQALFNCLVILFLLILRQENFLLCTSDDDLSFNNNNNKSNNNYNNEDILDNNNHNQSNIDINSYNNNLPLNLIRNSNLSNPQQIPSLQSNNTTGGEKDEAQNQFQSSISCGHLEFYVQLTFNKPFKGLVYAYKMYQSESSARYDHYYPLEILDSCTIRGNGASIVYLELSFLSECVEKLPTLYHNMASSSSSVESTTTGLNNNNNNNNNVQHSNQTTELIANSNDTINSNSNSGNIAPTTSSPSTIATTTFNTDGFMNSHIFNLDGFNFRRALNDQQPAQLNISKDETYQLSLYIQNDPKIEQKFDSKVLVQCSPQVTKNIVLEQNYKSSTDNFFRKIDHHNSLPLPNLNGPQPRSIKPKANLTILSYDDNENEIDVVHLIESRMDILRGRIPFLKVVDGNVELGDDVTLIIRTRQLDDYDSKISNCYAYDERDSIRYQLTNQEGCASDSSVMAPFKVLHNVGAESKVYYTTFAAFKFPGSQYLNIQCTMLVCRQVCPKPNCDHEQQT